MSDKMNKKLIIVLTKADYLSYHPPQLPSTLVCLLCVCLDIDIIIVYKKAIILSEENRFLSM